MTNRSRSVLDANGMAVSAICGDLGGYGFSRAADNSEKIEKSKRIIDFALQMGANIITTHIGVIPDEKNDTYRVMAEACNTLGEYAEEMGVYFAVETGPEPASVLREFLDSLSSDAIKVNFDPANLVMVTGDDPVRAVYTLRECIIHTHAKDGIQLQPCDRHEIYEYFATRSLGRRFPIDDYIREVPLGAGGVDFDAYLSALADIGYKGYLTVERRVGNDPLSDVGEAVTFLREKIAKYN